ncbi:hypothetical protein PHISP_02847 [Aspergillus sp. HF37]|nr:hypothetical protein PHISP_02847 [Aspergillus sp. HF37]
MGIIGGCVTAMRPFVRRYFPRLLGSLPSEAPSEGSYPQPRSSRQLHLRNQLGLTDGGKQHSTVLKTDMDDDNGSEVYILGGGVDGI